MHHLIMMHHVYLLKTRHNPTRHCVGFTANLKTRLASHNAGQNLSTAANRPWSLAGYFCLPG